MTAIADFVGEWRGETGTKVELHLTLGSDGQYALYWLTGPGAGSIPRGTATREGSSLVLKYRDGEMTLTRSSQNTLAGKYFTERSNGPVAFSKVSVGPPATIANAASAESVGAWAVGRWSGKIYVGSVSYFTVLNVYRGGKGYICRFDSQGYTSNTSDNCQINTDQIKFDAGLARVELSQSGPNALTGTHRMPGIARMLVALKRD
jgi:hypothetical protein